MFDTDATTDPHLEVLSFTKAGLTFGEITWSDLHFWKNWNDMRLEKCSLVEGIR
jgi:hypothetical protein